MSAQERVDTWYQALVNKQYDVSHGYASLEDLRSTEARYQEALAARDAEAWQPSVDENGGRAR